MTRNSEVVGSTSDEATGVLTWLLRTCPTAHSDCSKLGDEKYVTGKCPSWRIITIGPWTKRALLARRGNRARQTEKRPAATAAVAFRVSCPRAARRTHACPVLRLVCCAQRRPRAKYGDPRAGPRASAYAPDGRHEVGFFTPCPAGRPDTRGRGGCIRHGPRFRGGGNARDTRVTPRHLPWWRFSPSLSVKRKREGERGTDIYLERVFIVPPPPPPSRPVLFLAPLM